MDLRGVALLLESLSAVIHDKTRHGLQVERLSTAGLELQA
jgi:hypothetical protein